MYLDKNFRKLRIVGKTSDDKSVLAGIFPIVNSEGIALDIMIETCKDEGYVIDWLDFIYDSIRTGWKLDNTISKIKAALDLIYGEQYSDEWLSGIEEWRAKTKL